VNRLILFLFLVLVALSVVGLTASADQLVWLTTIQPPDRFSMALAVPIVLIIIFGTLEIRHHRQKPS